MVVLKGILLQFPPTLWLCSKAYVCSSHPHYGCAQKHTFAVPTHIMVVLKGILLQFPPTLWLCSKAVLLQFPPTLWLCSKAYVCSSHPHYGCAQRHTFAVPTHIMVVLKGSTFAVPTLHAPFLQFPPSRPHPTPILVVPKSCMFARVLLLSSEHLHLLACVAFCNSQFCRCLLQKYIDRQTNRHKFLLCEFTLPRTTTHTATKEEEKRSVTYKQLSQMSRTYKR